MENKIPWLKPPNNDSKKKETEIISKHHMGDPIDISAIKLAKRRSRAMKKMA